jgi:hypothetical protein
VFYVNGFREYGTKNFLSTDEHSNVLKFALVVQMENMLKDAVATSITVLHYHSFLGIVCEVSQNYSRQFMVYIA